MAPNQMFGFSANESWDPSSPGIAGDIISECHSKISKSYDKPTKFGQASMFLGCVLLLASVSAAATTTTNPPISIQRTQQQQHLSNRSLTLRQLATNQSPTLPLPPMVPPPSSSPRQKHLLLDTRSSNPYTSGSDQLMSESSPSMTTVLQTSIYTSQPQANSSWHSTPSMPFKCPEQFGYFSDTRDCTRYFVCVFGDALHETCTGGLYFSSELQTCDWPNNVVCSVNSVRKEQNYLRTTSNKDNSIRGASFSSRKKQLTELEETQTPGPTTTTEPSELNYDYSSNDLDNPEYDESIASFVDQNGEVYVDDGPGGLFSVMGRSASISDHDKPIFQAADTNSINDKKSKATKDDSPKNKVSKESRSKFDNYQQKVGPEDEKSGHQAGRNEACLQQDNNQQQNCTQDKQRLVVQFDDQTHEAQTTVNQADKLRPGFHEDEEIDGDEHLRPRVNIVKKQLKDEYGAEGDEEPDERIEKNNEVDSTEPDIDSGLENTEAAEQSKVTNLQDDDLTNDVVTNDQEIKKKKNKVPEIVTFMADTNSDDYLSKRDLWNFAHRNPVSTLSSSIYSGRRGKSLADQPRLASKSEGRNSYSSYPSHNLYNTIGQFTILGSAGSSAVAGTLGTSDNSYSKYRRSQISRPETNPLQSLSEDSIMSIFRRVNKYSEPRNGPGGSSDSTVSVNKQQLSKPSRSPPQSTSDTFLQSFTLPMYSSYSALHPQLSTPARHHLIKPKSISTKSLLNGLDPTNATIIKDKNAQIIFYSYRNQQLDSTTPTKHPSHSTKSTSSPAATSTRQPKSSNLLQSASTGRSNGKELGSEIFSIALGGSHKPDQATKKSAHSKQSSISPNTSASKKAQFNRNSIVTETPVVYNIDLTEPPPTTETSSAGTTASVSAPTTLAPPTIGYQRQRGSLYAGSTEDMAANFIPKPTKLEPTSKQTTTPLARKENQSGCDGNFNCRLPKCFCPGTIIPTGFKRSQIPQMILLTFDDAVNDINFPLYQEIFERTNQGGGNRRNPNGCPIRGTFFVSHEWTDYGKVQTLYARGHEIASHSITHSFGEKFSAEDWRKEIAGQREILHRFSGIPRHEIRGMRAPFLQIGGDQQFQMLLDANFTYDSSIAIFDNAPAYWPFTLDFAIQHDCMITPCPTRSYPGIWEIGLTMWQDLMGGGRCTMGSSCTPPPTEQAVYDLIMNNFKHHYDTNRAPFGLFYHSGWFTTPHHKAGFLRFVDDVLRLGDVYFVTNWQLLQWMQNPRPLDHLQHFKPWRCANNKLHHHHHQQQQQQQDAEATNGECRLPNICHVKFRNTKKNRSNGLWSSRYFKTCQKCPTDYPWIDNVDQLLLSKES